MAEKHMTVVEEIAAERRRQIEAEGWTAEHDGGHNKGELAFAACSYAMNAALASKFVGNGTIRPDKIEASAAATPAPFGWPWSREWWKPKGRRRDLIRAAALIVAEIERLDRAAK